MRLLLRFLVAFCVATVLAQCIILTFAAVRGNLKQDTPLKVIALLNGIDITGEQLQKMLEESQSQPVPTYEDVRDAQAEMSKNLQMREDSIRRMKAQIEEMLAQSTKTQEDFDRRKDEFYKLLEEKEANLLDASLLEVRRTLEVLSPEQSKEQIKKMYENDQIDDIVAIFKEMPLDKRKKIMGEFTGGPDEVDLLADILARTRAGEPASSIISDARQQAPTQ
ncbi:MAG: hypothetical protein R3C53_01835 [Pirellulaceae bacterium]